MNDAQSRALDAARKAQETSERQAAMLSDALKHQRNGDHLRRLQDAAEAAQRVSATTLGRANQSALLQVLESRNPLGSLTAPLGGVVAQAAAAAAMTVALARTVEESRRRHALMGSLASSSVARDAVVALRGLVERVEAAKSVPPALRAYSTELDVFGARHGALGAYHIAALTTAYRQYSSVSAAAARLAAQSPLGEHLRSLGPTLDTGTLARLSSEFAGLMTVAQRTADLQAMLGHFTAAARADSRGGEWIPGLSSAIDVATRFNRLGAAVGRTWEAMAARTDLHASLQTPIREAPTQLLYSAARVTALVVQRAGALEDVADAIGAAVGPEDDSAASEHAAWLAGAGDIADRLEAVGRGLGVAFNGAVEALRARRPDYMRHVAVSLRELLDHLLTTLAPDAEVRAWYTEHPLVPEVPLCEPGTRKISRAARLAFLFRHATAAYAKLMSGDRLHIQSTFYALNDGTHKMPAPFEEAELDLLVMRVTGHLHLLLCVAEK